MGRQGLGEQQKKCTLPHTIDIIKHDGDFSPLGPGRLVKVVGTMNANITINPGG